MIRVVDVPLVIGTAPGERWTLRLQVKRRVAHKPPHLPIPIVVEERLHSAVSRMRPHDLAGIDLRAVKNDVETRGIGDHELSSRTRVQGFGDGHADRKSTRLNSSHTV